MTRINTKTDLERLQYIYTVVEDGFLEWSLIEDSTYNAFELCNSTGKKLAVLVLDPVTLHVLPWNFYVGHRFSGDDRHDCNDLLDRIIQQAKRAPGWQSYVTKRLERVAEHLSVPNPPIPPPRPNRERGDPGSYSRKSWVQHLLGR